MIEEACQEDIDGLIVTFPSSQIVDAVEACALNGIPIIDINAGPDLAAAGEARFSCRGGE